MARVTSFATTTPNDERESALRAALQEICQNPPFEKRGGKVLVNWLELQRRVHELAEEKIGA